MLYELVFILLFIVLLFIFIVFIFIVFILAGGDTNGTGNEF